MAIFVFAETAEGKYKKAAIEAVSYAKAVADKAGDSVTAIAFNATDPSDVLYKYGATKVLKVNNPALAIFTPDAYAKAIAQLVGDASTVILTHTNDGGTFAPLLAVALDANIVSNVTAAPESVSPFVVERKSYSGKGIMVVQAEGKNVITVLQGSFGVIESAVSGSEETVSVDVQSKLTAENQAAQSAKINLIEAERVVSAGRGMKAPENWGMIEELADVLGAATACSKPCSDIGWRPHSEHVGQTGKAISPDLYIAVGISGAIQHLAGVGTSRVIVVINSDPEAPFFKAADYGVVGDAFQVVPALIQKIKAFKGV
ncbi:unnamed protein product [Notodromas monacha]|uniref:Electron transfer flavoprotein subunit alpha n=1 Tax=Notodromas monacha TaxID=399045 RepID=A0A7R9GLI7_9CRUS|nr:unnamed protein product [Notodromas monacha]CAG0925948.1 unnamed protein product [Notodromas monacha]